MSTLVCEEPLADNPQPAAPTMSKGDTLAASVATLLIMTVAQRLIGFGRGVLFCRWLEPEQLGQWDVAFGFLNLAAPLVVLGLPGSFGRYVEYYRQRGQFGLFLKRTTRVCAVMCVLATVIMIVYREWFSQLIFGEATSAALGFSLALCLATVTVHNFLLALFIAVRKYRFVTVLQFAQSMGFAVVSLALLALWPSGATTIVLGYALATVLSTFGSFACLRTLASAEPDQGPPIRHSEFWAKLVPFAMWMWITNLLFNLFEVIDRYMIIHHSGMSADEALRQVGYYHSSRIVPLLFVAIAGMMGSIITPHLTQDWECGRREAVERRLNLVLKTLLLALFAGGVAVLFVAPWLFNIAFQNKFAGGLQVLPFTLAYCTWFGTMSVAQNYLWCAERPGVNSFAVLLGLLLNICCNVVLLPQYGLEGAVWATSAANLFSLSLIYILSIRAGMRVDAGTWVLTFAPLLLACGVWVALAAVVGLVLAAICTPWLLSAAEKESLSQAVRQGAEKLRYLWQQSARRRNAQPDALAH